MVSRLCQVRNTRRESAYDLSLTGQNVLARRSINPSAFDKLLGPLEKPLLSLDSDDLSCQLRLERGKFWGDAKVTSLMLACRLGSPRAVDALIKRNADVHAVANYTTGRYLGVDDGRYPEVVKCTALRTACEQGYLKIVRLLLDAHADANELARDEVHNPNKDERSPLVYACENGHDTVVKLLLEYKAEVNTTFKSGRTVLMAAAHHGFSRCARHLLEHKADINAMANVGETALSFASRFGHTSTARLLIEADINVEAEIQACKGWTSLHRACAGGHTDTAQEVLNVCPRLLEVKDSLENRTPLLVAAGVGSHTTVVMLLEAKADPQPVDHLERNAVYLAAMNGHANVLTMLLKHIKRDCTPQQQRAIINSITVLDDVPQKPDEEPRKQHMTPLMKATCMGHESAVTTLLLAKASSDKVYKGDERPLTAFQLAAATGFTRLIELLREHSHMDQEALQQQLKKAQHVAEEHGHSEVVELLLSRGRSGRVRVESDKEVKKRGDLVKQVTGLKDAEFLPSNMASMVITIRAHTQDWPRALLLAPRLPSPDAASSDLSDVRARA